MNFMYSIGKSVIYSAVPQTTRGGGGGGRAAGRGLAVRGGAQGINYDPAQLGRTRSQNNAKPGSYQWVDKSTADGVFQFLQMLGLQVFKRDPLQSFACRRYHRSSGPRPTSSQHAATRPLQLKQSSCGGGLTLLVEINREINRDKAWGLDWSYSCIDAGALIREPKQRRVKQNVRYRGREAFLV